MIRLDSLAFRLFASAAVWTLIVLPVAALFLISYYKDSVERSFDARLNLYLTTLIATTPGSDDGQIAEAPKLGDPVFSLPFSGWYWQIKALDLPSLAALVSESLVDETLKTPSEMGIKANDNLLWQAYVAGPEGQHLRAVEREINFGEGERSLRFSFVVAGNSEEIERDIGEFTTMLVLSLTALGLGLVLATLFQVRFGLAPMRAIGEGLAAIRSGKASRLEGELPAEIEPLQVELNALIQSNRDIVERARTHVGNLAHALKTPLSVITNEARGEESLLARKVDEQTEIMRDQITHHLDRARMAARVNVISSMTDVEPVMESLARALGRIHEARNLEITVNYPGDIKFRGEKQDLEEMVGNLLDNACKWATSHVVLDVLVEDELADEAQILITIDDDGPGLSESDRVLAVKRGQRLDETKPGSGLGLSIVADLAHLYKGAFHLEESAMGGLSARLRLPEA